MTAIPLHDLYEVATKGDIAGLRAELKMDVASLQRTMTNWMLTLLVAIIGAMTSIGFLN